jgi:hypothetical protein
MDALPHPMHDIFTPSHICTQSEKMICFSIDDFSRFMLYGQLLEKELSWTHTRALENVILTACNLLPGKSQPNNRLQKYDCI